MRYLLDTNVWLEAITQGPQAADAVTLITAAPQGSLATTDFAVGLILTAFEPKRFAEFIDDLIRLGVFTLHLAPSDLYAVLDRMEHAKLDFDDAFQYFAAERFGLRIVSFDTDFDRTPRGRLTRGQVVKEIGSAGNP